MLPQSPNSLCDSVWVRRSEHLFSVIDAHLLLMYWVARSATRAWRPSCLLITCLASGIGHDCTPDILGRQHRGHGIAVGHRNCKHSPPAFAQSAEEQLTDLAPASPLATTCNSVRTRRPVQAETDVAAPPPAGHLPKMQSGRPGSGGRSLQSRPVTDKFAFVIECHHEGRHPPTNHTRPGSAAGELPNENDVEEP